MFGKIEEAPQIIVYRIIACFVFLPKEQYRLSVIGCVQKSFIGYQLSFKAKAITDNRYDNLEKKVYLHFFSMFFCGDIYLFFIMSTNDEDENDAKPALSIV